MEEQKAKFVQIKPTEIISQFEFLEREELPEIKGYAYRFVHKPTNARLLWLANDDTNRSFSISFKTPPQDDTGVFHILEHSVLCGSRKYPLKEPFVNLLKTSMQTFLNAFTFPDKTMYPVASTNVCDLENLIDVYLDAVLHPALYTNKNIFLQEGWHYELQTPTDDLSINGVVYNEMKGALSDPEDVLLMQIKRNLFPQCAYGFESGGNPTSIPNLTYEAFLDTHKRHYKLENAYIVLYGDLDIARELAFLNARLREEMQGEDTSPHALLSEPNPLELQAPLVAEHRTYTIASGSHNSVVGLAYVIGTYQDREKILATQILLDALMGSNEAPLKRRLLEANLGSDVSAYVLDGIAQPFVVFEVKGAHSNCVQEFKQLLEESVSRLVQEGLDADRIEAAISSLEFDLKEADYSYPNGIAYAITALSSWLYDDERPTDYLKYESELHDLHASVGLGIFEDLLKELILNSTHNCAVSVMCEDQEDLDTQTNTLEETHKLQNIKAHMSKKELEHIVDACKELEAAQSKEDSASALAKLPQVPLSQVGEAQKAPKVRNYEGAPFECRQYCIDTNDIIYSYLYFDLDTIGWTEIPYVTVLVELLGKLDTKQHTAAELDYLIQANLGSSTFFCEPFYSADNPLEETHAKLVVEAAALSKKVASLAQLPMEICLETLFEDKERMYAILAQQRISMEQGFLAAGHSCAMSVCQAQFSQTAQLAEQMGGVLYYRFLCKLLDRWDKRAAGLAEILRNLQGRIFKANNISTSFAASDADLKAYWEQAQNLGLAFDPVEEPKQLQVEIARQEQKGLIIPADVCYVAQGGAGALLSPQQSYSGTWAVAMRALNLSYLWNEVRIKGGAYGVGLALGTSSLMTFYSYRDPAVLPTLKRYRAAGSWLASWEPTMREFEGYIVSSVARLDAPVKPRALMRRYDSLYFTGRPYSWFERIREEILATTVEEVKALAPAVDAVGKSDAICVMGGAELLAQDKNLHIETLV